MVELAHRELGDGPPVVILHGLFGSGVNWRTIAKALSDRYRVLLPDARNHGESAHAPDGGYEALAGDLDGWLGALGLERIALIGHSMGGKTAMHFALGSPERVAALVVVDVAPVAYPSDGEHLALIEAMQKLPLDSLPDRRSADRALSAAVADPGLRGFLLHSLERSSSGFRWRLNLPALARGLPALRGFPAQEGVYEGPALLLHAERSGYVDPAGERAFRQRFPAGELARVADAGHWLHAEQPQIVIERLSDFLARHWAV